MLTIFYLKSQNCYADGHTDFLVLIIELLRSLKDTLLVENNLGNVNIDRTTCLIKKELLHMDTRFDPNSRKASILKCITNSFLPFFVLNPGMKFTMGPNLLR